MTPAAISMSFITFSLDKLIEAYGCFKKILELSPNYLKANENLELLKVRLVDPWHIERLNDLNRSTRYKKALQEAFRRRHQTTVLNINTGTGLLALIASESGAKQTFASEESPLLGRIAAQAFQRHSAADRIELLQKPATEINAQADLGGEVDLIVTEFTDCAVLADGVVDMLIHAKENLLKSGGLIIPCRLKFFVAGYESEQLSGDLHMIREGLFTETLYVPNYSLSTVQTEQWVKCRVDQVGDFKLATGYSPALTINLNSLDDLYGLQNGTMSTAVELVYVRPDVILDGFVVWYELSLDNEQTITLSSNPVESDPADPDRFTTWEVAIFRLEHRFYEPYSTRTSFTVRMSAMNGILQLEHALNEESRAFTGLTPDMARYINDTDLLDIIEHDVFREVDRRFQTPTQNVADFQPFPMVGLAMLKERRLGTLFCSRQTQELVTFVAAFNGLDMGRVVFLADASDLLAIESEFDVILLTLVESNGTLNSGHVSLHGKLKQTKLTRQGFMVPDRLEIMAHSVGSLWLRTLARVFEPQSHDRLRIGPLVNEFASALRHGLSQTFNHFRWFRTYRLAEVPLNDQFYESAHRLFVGRQRRISAREPVGVLFFFNIKLTPSGPAVSTKSIRTGSFWKLSCYTIDGTRIDRINGHATVRYRQNNGVMHIDVRETSDEAEGSA